MRLGGCVAKPKSCRGDKARRGVLALKAEERNAERVWHVCLSTGLFAIPETIDARRGIEEV